MTHVDVEVSVCIPTIDLLGSRVHSIVQSARVHTDASHEIVIIENRQPMQGVTDPINSTIRAARGKYLVVVNDDVVFLPDWWPPLRDALDRGAKAARSYTVDKQTFGWWAFAIERSLVDEMLAWPGELWDPQFVLWYQDADFGKRLTDKYGAESLVDVMASRVTHAQTQSHDPTDPTTAARINEDARLFHLKWS